MTDPDDRQTDDFFRKGWRRFPFDPALSHWVHRALPAARRAVAAPENARWLRCAGTWFVGVHALPNGARGEVGGGPALGGTAVEFIRCALGLKFLEWDRGQLSVCYPGYPLRMESESEASYRYRRHRDAAHVDGLLADGPRRRRFLRERHAFILGIPLVDTDPLASPLVVWERSHEIIRQTFIEAFDAVPADLWSTIDITDIYHAARRRVFQTCRRIEIPAAPGEAYVLHRLALHGIAPWRSSGTEYPDGRMICYFRPESRRTERWLSDP